MIIPEQVFTAKKPFFIFSEQEIRSSVTTVRNFWQKWSRPGFEIFFSVKVNPNPHILKIISQFVEGFDVSSIAEARLVRKLGIDCSRITWSGPAKTRQGLTEALGWGLRCFHLDSFDEWQLFRSFGPEVIAANRFSLRLSSNKIHNQKLGWSALELKKLSQSDSRKWPAVHSYLGRETFGAASIQDFSDHLQGRIAEGLFVENPEIFLGAGLPSQKIIESHLLELAPKVLPQKILNLEAGRALIQNAGCYGTQILSNKVSNGKRFIIIDGGLQHLGSHLLSPSYKSEAVEIRFFRAGQELFDRSDMIAVHGSLSLWHDALISDIPAPQDLRRGDWFVANHVGAYGFTAASSQFLGPSQISEWLLLEENSRLQKITPENLVPYCGAGL